MNTLILTTWGTGLPLYQRETVCRVDTDVFVRLEAQAACVEGTATARLTDAGGKVLAEATVEAVSEAPAG
jgi:hypothetical protein